MAENKIKLIYEGNLIGTTNVPLDLPPSSVDENTQETNITNVNEEGTALMQVGHQFVNIGETISQIKRSTAVQVTEHGTIRVTQFRQEIASRGEEVWYYKNVVGAFEGSLIKAQEAFPEVDFDELKVDRSLVGLNPEFPSSSTTGNVPEWETLSEYDGEKTGKPTTWDKWADATQLALDGIGLIPGIGEFADCANGIISLARGNYGDAALSFAAMIPIFGAGATITKHAKNTIKAVDKVKDNRGVYDLILKKADDIKNGEDIKGYVGQSKDVFERMSNHFRKRGKLRYTNDVLHGVVHKMKGSTKLEREIYEQFIILRKYGGEISKRGGDVKYLLNKVNPVGGKFDLKSAEGLKTFYKKAEEIADRYSLRKNFN